MVRCVSTLLVTLLIVTFSTGSKGDTVTSNLTETQKYGPLFQLEIKDQASSEGFRGMKVTKRFTRRTPNFYREVISDAQRDTIY